MASDDSQGRGNADTNMSSSNDSLWESGGKVPISVGPRSSQNMSQKSKRRRRTFAELCRDFVCGVNGCDRRYASAHALQQHKRIKHQQDNASAQINVTAMKKRAAADVLPLLSLVSGQKSSPTSGMNRQLSETGSGMDGMEHRERHMASQQYSYDEPYSSHGRMGHESGHYPSDMREAHEDLHGDYKPRHMDSYYEHEMDNQYHHAPSSYHHHRPGYDGAPCTGPCCEHNPTAQTPHHYDPGHKYPPQSPHKAGMSRPHPFSASTHPEDGNFSNSSRNRDSSPYEGKAYSAPPHRSSRMEPAYSHNYYQGSSSRYEPYHGGPQRHGVPSPNASYHRAADGEWEGEHYARGGGNELKYGRGYYPSREYNEGMVADAAGRETRRHSPYMHRMRSSSADGADVYGHRDSSHYRPEEWAQPKRDVRPMVVEEDEREYEREGGRPGRATNMPSRTILEQPHPRGHWNPVMQEPTSFTAAV
eukprot:comp18162_c0_seq1/m.18941 comp18162_c0_seq1/g.18941  ORF comp18162_c0_seq1/g.18941 comp18162_c0_seq1/m.18941 type:complete len:475 (-) comp18162_c0_seq1:659-2083(-)